MDQNCYLFNTFRDCIADQIDWIQPCVWMDYCKPRWISKLELGIVFYFRKRKEKTVFVSPHVLLYRWIASLRVRTHMVK